MTLPPLYAATYHAHKASPVSASDIDDAYAANALLESWRSNWGVYGVDKLTAAAARSGHRLGRDHVARLMRILGVSGAVRGSHRTVTTRRDPTADRHCPQY